MYIYKIYLFYLKLIKNLRSTICKNFKSYKRKNIYFYYDK